MKGFVSVEWMRLPRTVMSVGEFEFVNDEKGPRYVIAYLENPYPEEDVHLEVHDDVGTFRLHKKSGRLDVVDEVTVGRRLSPGVVEAFPNGATLIVEAEVWREEDALTQADEDIVVEEDSE